MRNQTYLTFFCLLFLVQLGWAQTDFQQTDSVSVALYNASKWNELINFGTTVIAKGDDFPALRLRIAFAAFMQEKYSLALQNYDRVLLTDRYNQTALYYAYLCNLYLNRPKEASYLAKNIEDNPIDDIYLKPTFLALVGAETSAKFTDNLARGNSNFYRIFAQLRVSYPFYIDYSVLFYNQQYQTGSVNQVGNHLKLSYMPVKNVSVIWAWNYLNTTYLETSQESNMLLLGLKYNRPFYQLQLDASYTNNIGAMAKQQNFQVLTYLTGNLNLYLNNRVTHLSTTDGNGEPLHSIIYNPTVGVRLFKKMWTALGATFGEQYNYAEADGLYQYNGLDLTTFKFGADAFYVTKKRLLLSLGYTLEKKKEDILKLDYLQHSINAGITWNF